MVPEAPRNIGDILPQIVMALKVVHAVTKPKQFFQTFGRDKTSFKKPAVQEPGS